ncbi:MAG: NPCBM/NEW2 domain-containing protein [bacterium]
MNIGFDFLTLLIILSGTINKDNNWQDKLMEFPYPEKLDEHTPLVYLVRQDYEQLERNLSVIRTPLKIGDINFQRGLGTHSFSHLRIYSPDPIDRFCSWIGVDNNERTQGGNGSVSFSIIVNDKEIYRSQVMHGGQRAEKVDLDIHGAKIIDLHVDDGGDGPACDHANWADAFIITSGGKIMYIDELKTGVIPLVVSKYPFSFSYNGKSSNDLLDLWEQECFAKDIDADRRKYTYNWLDKDSGLKVQLEIIRYNDYPALDWILYFENIGQKDTYMIENIKALDLTFQSPINSNIPYKLYKTNGSPANPTDFEAKTIIMKGKSRESMDGGGGRSSNKDFPFFKIETGEGSYIIAVGWSGQWKAVFECIDNYNLHATAGLEKTHFLLYPGEKVRSPRMLILFHSGDTFESNAKFRQLIYKHYTATRNGQKVLPILFCNTCFTRGGGWLNECNAENQISLIKAYAPLGLEALITDAGWFEGGWPDGAGNWNPRKDAYPEGMGPVAASAKEHGMVYGLWFEPERVVSGTWIHKNHPEWLLTSTDGQQSTYLLNFALQEVQDYMFNIVKGFMELPGFRFYRQDFNMDPLPYWQYNDAPNRQGITEIKYIEGLYAYWDRIAQTWPDSIREECASGGRRIDLETIMRMHIHQKTDYWFDNDVDQASIWGLSQYLPNNTFVAHLNRMDNYSFHSTFASSLCLGWIADASDFNAELGKKMLDLYLETRHLLIGAWYPLLPYSRDPMAWMASQYHRPDLQQGIILVFRHNESPYRTVEISLHDLDPMAKYSLIYTSSGEKISINGASLMTSFIVTLNDKCSSELIIYSKE